MRSTLPTLIPVCLVLSLAACGKKAEQTGAPAAKAVAETTATPPGASPARAGAPVAAAVALPQLAYAYAAQIETSAAALPGLVARHEAACRAAGPEVCQITAMSLTTDGGARAHIGLRAQPDWLQGFRGRLAADAQAAGGRVVKSSAVTEDLSRQLVDTEAALRAKTLLAERLEGLLAHHQGRLADLLDVEKQLTDTRGQIDAARSELAMMRARVATSEMTLDYAAPASLAAVWAPATQAAQGATGLFAGGVGIVISLIAAVAPLALLAGVIALAVSRFKANKRGKGG